MAIATVRSSIMHWTLYVLGCAYITPRTVAGKTANPDQLKTTRSGEAGKILDVPFFNIPE
jgi:hypothetical protein